MKSRFVLGTLVMATALLSSGTLNATPVPTEMYTKTRTVNFSLRNDSKAEMKVKVGENEITLQPGKAVAVKLAIGDAVLAVENSPHYPAGTVIVVSRSELSDATIVLH